MFGFLKSKKETKDTPPISAQYTKLRNIIINLNPESQDIKPTDDFPNVWGILIEFSSKPPNLAVSVAALADGHTSIYGSEGAAFVGINSFPEIAEVSKYILTLSEKLLSNAKPTTEFPIAKFRTVNFFIFTYSGAFMNIVEENELYGSEHPFAPLYRAYHEILNRNKILHNIK